MIVASLFMTAACALAQPTTSVAIERALKDTLATAAEASHFQATSTHAEVVAFLDRLAGDAPGVARRLSMGTSV